MAEGFATRRVLASLPGGIWGDGPEPLHQVALRGVDGADELFLLDSADLPPGQRATALLARCIEDDGGGLAERLTVGDREALLLQLRRLTLGEMLDCTLQCPDDDCRGWMEMELAVQDVLLPPYTNVCREYDVSIAAEGQRYDVSFRQPTALDLNVAAALARSDPAGAAAGLLRSCVVRASAGGRGVRVEALGPEAAAQISAAMVELDPQGELELDGVCPVCAHPFHVLFDAGSFILQELDARAARLLLEVHTIALHYHWAERDILALPAGRRKRYLDLLADSVGSGPGGSGQEWATP